MPDNNFDASEISVYADRSPVARSPTSILSSSAARRVISIRRLICTWKSPARVVDPYVWQEKKKRNGIWRSPMYIATCRTLLFIYTRWFSPTGLRVRHSLSSLLVLYVHAIVSHVFAFVARLCVCVQTEDRVRAPSTTRVKSSWDDLCAAPVPSDTAGRNEIQILHWPCKFPNNKK